MQLHTYVQSDPHYPQPLSRMHVPPERLYVQGDNLFDLINRPRVAIVGSRQISPYGKQVTAQFARQLAEQGVVIISGLAYGVDAQAHAAAVKAGGQVIAVLPTSLDAVYPASNRQLAQQIVAGGGALVSSYASGSQSHKGNFVARNEIVAALSQAVVIVEAAHKSGSLHTASFAQNMGIDVLAVPGNITSLVSAGTNQLIKAGAAPVTGINDILAAINLAPITAPRSKRGESPQQQALLDLLQNGVVDGFALQEQSKLSAAAFNETLTMLEITGAIRPLGGNQWTVT